MCRMRILIIPMNFKIKEQCSFIIRENHFSKVWHAIYPGLNNYFTLNLVAVIAITRRLGCFFAIKL